jgi:hypothetical protein
MTAYTGTDSDLSSTTLASAFVEACRKLNEAEITRNAANPSVTPKNNVTMSAAFDGKVFSIAVTLPYVPTLDSAGKYIADVTDYLGSTYTAFTVGTGDAKSTDLPSLVLEIAQKLAAAEKTVAEADRPNNVQIQLDDETGIATITGNIPFTAGIDGAGVITLTALDYV